MSKSKENLILGIDPGTRFMGYGLVLQKGNKNTLVTLGVVKTDHLSDHLLRLKNIHLKTESILKEYNPDCVAIEAPFYGKNVQSVLKLGRVQGIVMGLTLNYNIPVFEYSPKKIKQAVTGNGNSDKEQVSKMVQNILQFKENDGLLLDATDAVATALCHSFQFNVNQTNHKTSSSNGGDWNSFLKNNKNRIIK